MAVKNRTLSSAVTVNVSATAIGVTAMTTATTSQMKETAVSTKRDTGPPRPTRFL